jgi:hypothetical protein
MHRKPSSATVIALLALFIALGGTAIAARPYLITSTSQIKPSVFKKLRGRTGLRGPTGPAGAAGATGRTGSAAVLSALTAVLGPSNRVPAHSENGAGGQAGTEGSIATCPAGEHVVSGGSSVVAGVVAGEISAASEDHGSWLVVVANASEFKTGTVQAVAYCASTGQAVAAAKGTLARTAAHAQERRLAAQLARRLTRG